MTASIWKVGTSNAFSTTLNGGITDTDTTITLTSVTGLQYPGVLVIDRIDANNTSTPVTREYISFTGIAGLGITGCTRGLGGSLAQAHSSGAKVEETWSVTHWNDFIDSFTAEHSVAGIHDATKVAMIAGTQTVTGDKTFSGAVNFTGTVTGVAAFWANVPGTPTRVSDTQFTITDTSNTNNYDLLFKKGVVLKWLESSTFQTAMVISSSYGTNTVTINIVGDSLTAGFTSMQYAIPRALKETFIIPGTLVAGTDLAKTWYIAEPVFILSSDAYVKTAGTTNSTVFDINDDGTTKFTTKPTITSTTTSDIDNVSDSPSTSVAASSLITVDIDSVSTTAPLEGYVDVWYYPESWRYR